jgi:hypothetical protein
VLTQKQLRFAVKKLAELRGWRHRDLEKQAQREIEQWLQIQAAVEYAKKISITKAD